MARTLADLGIDARPVMTTTLANMGQRYQDYPPASFDQRFGPFPAPEGPVIEQPDQEQLRRLFEQQLLRQTPGGVVPGTKTWPHGYTLAGDVVQGNFPIAGPRVRLPNGQVVPLSIFQPSPEPPAPAPGRGRDPYLSIVPKPGG